MASRHRRSRLVVLLLLLGLAVGWPLLGSAPGVAGEAGRSVGSAAPGDGCGGCCGGVDGRGCPASVCPVAAAILPDALSEPGVPGADRPGSAGRSGQGRVPEVQTPPPRPAGVA